MTTDRLAALQRDILAIKATAEEQRDTADARGDDRLYYVGQVYAYNEVLARIAAAGVTVATPPAEDPWPALLADPEFVAGMDAAMADFKAGRFVPWKHAQPAPDALRAAADAVCQAWIADEAGEETFDPNLIDALGDALYGKPEGTEA